MNKEIRYKILLLFHDKYPEPKIELVFSSDFELLLSVMLSAQSTDIMVNKVTQELFQVANTPEKILFLGKKRLINYIKGVGLYNIKALNIIRTSYLLLTQYKGKVPNNRIALESFPGVGRKTANIILNILFKKKLLLLIHMFLEYLIVLSSLQVKMLKKLKKN